MNPLDPFIAEAREAAKRIPDAPVRPCARVLAFPSPSERLAREARERRETRWTPPRGPGAAA